jgi:hypothetical protein
VLNIGIIIYQKPESTLYMWGKWNRVLFESYLADRGISPPEVRTGKEGQGFWEDIPATAYCGILQHAADMRRPGKGLAERDGASTSRFFSRKIRRTFSRAPHDL